MRPAGCLIFGMVLLASYAAAAGDIHKCVDKDGKVTISDTVCPEHARLDVQVPAPDERGPGASPGLQTTPPRGGYGEHIDRARAVGKDSSKAVHAPDGGG